MRTYAYYTNTNNLKEGNIRLTVYHLKRNIPVCIASEIYQTRSWAGSRQCAKKLIEDHEALKGGQKFLTQGESINPLLRGDDIRLIEL